MWGNYKRKIVGDRFHEGLNSDCLTLLIYQDTVLTEKQIKAHYDVFARGYNIDIWKSSHKQSTSRLPDKRLFKMLIFTPTSELTRETLWRGCEYYSQVNNLSCLEIKVVSKIRKNCFFEIKVDFKVNLKSRLIHELTWNPGCFQNVLELAFYNFSNSKILPTKDNN